MAAYPGWQAAILRKIGAPVTRANMRYMTAWQRAEGGSASYNPLNTTQPAGGASSYNSVGVRNYRNPQQGTNATAQTLVNGHYNNLVALLKGGHATARQLASAEAKTPWGTGAGILRVLGSGPVAVPQEAFQHPTRTRAQALSQSPVSRMQAPDSRNQLIQFVMANNAALAQGQSLNPQMFGLGQPQQQLPTSPLLPQGYKPLPQVPTAPRASGGKLLPFEGDTGHLKPKLLYGVSAAARAAGATKIKITSGYRSPAHNAAVGGVPRSNHITGDALDGYGYVPSRGWVPIGALVKNNASKYGLRSGDQPGFYHGGLDPVHVDTGANQR